MVLGGPYFPPWIVRGDQVFCRGRSGATDFGGEQLSYDRARSASVNEIAGLRKKKKNEEYDDAESVRPDSRKTNWKQVGAGWDNVWLDMTPKPITCEFESLARFTLVVRRLFVR